MFDNIIHDNHYHGIPLATEHGPFIENRLADTLATIEGLMEASNRIIAVCLELLVPDGSGFGFHLGNDHHVAEFVLKLQRQVRWKHTELHEKNSRRRKPIIDAIWQEVLTANGRTSYRVMLLLNREAYYEQSIGFDAANTLQYRARMAWAKVMQIHKHHSGGYIRFPHHGLMITDNTADGLFQVFAKASMLCAVSSQANGQRLMGFGSTRKARTAL